jgi:hypothetical protein
MRFISHLKIQISSCAENDWPVGLVPLTVVAPSPMKTNGRLPFIQSSPDGGASATNAGDLSATRSFDRTEVPMTKNKLEKGKSPFPDDLERNPGIGQSKGSFVTGVRPEEIEGQSTSEGDVDNDTTASGGVPQGKSERTNA